MKLQLTILILLAFVSIGNSQISGVIKDTSYFDGCNWTTCKDGNCMTTLLACGEIDIPDSLIYEGSGRDEKWSDTLTAQRFISDSNGNSYMIEYRYIVNDAPFDKIILDKNGVVGDKDSLMHLASHTHYIALVNIIAFKGNHKKIIASNIKAIYSPTECSADNPELWRKKIYEILKNKK